MDPQVRLRLEELEELVALLQAGGPGGAALAIAKNRVQQVAAAAAVVAAAGAITLDAALTTVGPNGKIRISANFSGVGGGGAGGIHAVLQVKIGAGAFVTQWTGAPFATASHVDEGIVFEFDSAAPAGTVLTVHWQTTAGDDALTLGGAAAPIAAVLLVEELP